MMIAYSIDYEVKGKECSKLIEAKNLDSANKKIGKKHGYKTGRMISIRRVCVIGYF